MHTNPFARLMTLVLFISMLGCSGLGLVTANGSSTALPVMEVLARQFEHIAPGYRFAYAGDGSSAGEKAVLNGTSDFATIARPVSPSARASLNVIPWFEDDIAIIAGSDVEITDISLADLRDLFDARKTTANSEDYVRVGKAAAHGTFQATAESLGLPVTALTADLVAGANAEVIHMVSAHTRAIGYVSGPIARDAIAQGAPIHLISIDGITPSPETLRDDSYPLGRTVSLVFHAMGNASAGARMFAIHATGPKGQKVIAQLGFRPMPEAARQVEALLNQTPGARP